MTDRRDKTGPAIVGEWPNSFYIGDRDYLYNVSDGLSIKAESLINNSVHIIDRFIHKMTAPETNS